MEKNKYMILPGQLSEKWDPMLRVYLGAWEGALGSS